jgi:hypothetical protein
MFPYFLATVNLPPSPDVNPIGLGFTILMGFLFLVIPRRFVLVPVTILVSFMTMGEAFQIAGAHFTMIRILVLFGWLRVILRGESRRLQWNAIDKVFVAWMVVRGTAYVLLWQSFEAINYQLGYAYNAFGFYFLFRFLMKDLDNVFAAFRPIALFAIPLAAAMAFEKSTGRNIFAIFGGVMPTTIIRDGVLRCQGPFAHPILAGTYGAVILPLCIALWWRGNKALALMGTVSALVITLTSASSGPLLSAVAGIVGLCMWRWRGRLRIVRWGMVLGLIGLHMVMKAPVWFLLARVDIFSGSTGYHRAFLIDRAVANFSDWWLVGTKSTEAWADADQHLFDVTNQYIWEGVEGGFLTLLLFIFIIGFSFQAVGRAVLAVKDKSMSVGFPIWALGASLLVHVVSYISVPYFDQMIVVWYLGLAMISSAREATLENATESTSGGLCKAATPIWDYSRLENGSST